MIATLLVLLALSAPPPPSPDPHPSACYAGWCPVPTTNHPITVTLRLKGHKGLWRCTITHSAKMRCVPATP